jgi:hypothetical protein
LFATVDEVYLDEEDLEVAGNYTFEVKDGLPEAVAEEALEALGATLRTDAPSARDDLG